MDYLSFPASLHIPGHDINELGTARLGPSGDAVDFHNDFVPLVPLGETATIEWVYAQRSLASYTGRVYLSTPTMLRLVGVDESLVARAQGIFATNTKLPGTVARDGLKQPAEIIYLSVGMVKLRTTYPCEAGQPLLLGTQVDFLTLSDLSLVVRQSIPLRPEETLLLCEVERSGNDNYIALSTYSAKLDRIGRED